MTLTSDRLRFPSKSHRSQIVFRPTKRTTKRPTNFTPIAPARFTPVRLSQNHQEAENGLQDRQSWSESK